MLWELSFGKAGPVLTMAKGSPYQPSSSALSIRIFPHLTWGPIQIFLQYDYLSFINFIIATKVSPHCQRHNGSLGSDPCLSLFLNEFVRHVWFFFFFFKVGSGVQGLWMFSWQYKCASLISCFSSAVLELFERVEYFKLQFSSFTKEGCKTQWARSFTSSLDELLPLLKSWEPPISRNDSSS